MSKGVWKPIDPTVPDGMVSPECEHEGCTEWGIYAVMDYKNNIQQMCEHHAIGTPEE